MVHEAWSATDIVVVVPTYNERASLPTLVHMLLELHLPGLRILVVDDGSPDGTGRIADTLAAAHPGRVAVMHRPVKDGLGRAYVAGLIEALLSGAEVVVQMDADLSHPVSAIPEMLRILDSSDAAVVIGSRYVAGGTCEALWPLRRRLLSRWANFYVRAILRLEVRDVTAGFKAWRAETLGAIDLPSVVSDGYSFQIETNYRTAALGGLIVETPIRFGERVGGASKMTVRVQLESARTPWRLRAHGPFAPGTEHALSVGR